LRKEHLVPPLLELLEEGRVLQILLVLPYVRVSGVVRLQD
jgi:hypothetical protein